MERPLVREGHVRHAQTGERRDDAVPPRREERRHRRQAGRPVGREQRLAVLTDTRQGRVVSGERLEHPRGGRLVGEGEICGQHEDGTAQSVQGGGDAGER